MTGVATIRRSPELLIRIISGVVLILVALATLVVDGFYFWGLMSVAALLMITEWSGLIGIRDYRGGLALAAMTIILIMTMPTHRFLEIQVVGGLAVLTEPS